MLATPDRLRRPLRSVRRTVLLRRRALAALLAALAVGTVAQAASRPPPRTVPVVTARTDLASGTVLRASDLTRAAYPPAARPRHAVPDPGSLVGRRVALPLDRGEPVTRTHLLGAGLLRRLPGRAAVAVRLPDAGLAALLHAGDRIDLLATDPRAGPRPLVRDGLVLAVPEVADDSAAVADRGRLVVLAVDPEEAGPLAVAANGGFVTVVWSSRDDPEPLR
jgi:Flp pilus assembly protein CpaB